MHVHVHACTHTHVHMLMFTINKEHVEACAHAITHLCMMMFTKWLSVKPSRGSRPWPLLAVASQLLPAVAPSALLPDAHPTSTRCCCCCCPTSCCCCCSGHTAPHSPPQKTAGAPKV